MKAMISRCLLFVGYGVIILFIVEIIGEFSQMIEGIYYLLGIPWRFPMMLAIFSFCVSFILDKKARKLAIIGFFGLAGLFLFFILIYIIIFINMVAVGR